MFRQERLEWIWWPLVNEKPTRVHAVLSVSEYSKHVPRLSLSLTTKGGRGKRRPRKKVVNSECSYFDELSLMGPPDLMYMSWPLQPVNSFLPQLLYPQDCRSCYQELYFCLVSLALCDSQSNATQQLKQHPCEVSQVWMFSMSQSIYRKKIKRSQATFFRATKTTHYSQTVSYLYKEKLSHLIVKRKVFFNRWMLRKSSLRGWREWVHARAKLFSGIFASGEYN